MPAARYRVDLGDRTFDLQVRFEGSSREVLLDGRVLDVELLGADSGPGRKLRIGGRFYDILLRRDSGRVELAIDGVVLEARVEDELAARLAKFGGSKARTHGRAVVAAPMPGLVLRVSVSPGDEVSEGQSLVVLQAMKMENELGSPRAGSVQAIHVQPGQAVEHGQILVELE